MEARSRKLSWWMGGFAALGVLVTHWLTYRFLLPDHQHRAAVLHDTGHSHLPWASVVGLALFTVASFRVCLLGTRSSAALPDFRPTALRLAGLQAVAWTALEVGERAFAGRLATIEDHALLATGLGVQVAVALVGALLLRVARTVLSVFARRTTPPRPRPQSLRLPARTPRRHRLRPLSGATTRRGPPPLLRPTS